MTIPTVSGLGDWTFIEGRWRVRHRRLVARLAGSDEWQEFEGTSELWLLLGGAGNVDDNFLGQARADERGCAPARRACTHDDPDAFKVGTIRVCARGVNLRPNRL